MKKITSLLLVLLTPFAAFAQEAPSQLLDLTHWKITLPVDVAKPIGSPDEIQQPALKTLVDAKHFFLNKAKGGAARGQEAIYRA